jgi:prolyl-tRNA synthetase
MFDVWFEDKAGKKQFVWQTSWGFSTRSIGSMIMVHSDNKGLVLPPRVAQIQVVLVPITYKDDDSTAIFQKSEEIVKALKEAGVRATFDDRENYNPGWKFNHWEIKGIPLRIELGKKDFEKSEVRVVRRDTGAKSQMSWANLTTEIPHLLNQIHDDMYQKARQTRDEHMKVAYNWEDFMTALNGRNIVLTPWCDEGGEEEKVKERTKEESLKHMQEAGDQDEEVLTGSAKTLCIPFDPIVKLKDGDKCFFTGKEAKVMALWGRSY